MQRLFITGVDHTVGSNLALALADRFDVFGVPLSHSACWGPEHRGSSTDDTVQLTRAICEAHPQWVIHCSGLSTNAWDLHGPRVVDGCCVDTARHLAELTQSIGARLTVVVSDALFAGPTAFHDEASLAWSPEPFAGRIRQVEQTCAGPHSLVVRTHAYGWSANPPQQHSFAEQLISALSAGAEIHTPGTHYASPILTTDLADLLVECLYRQLTGTIHLGGAERTNQYHFACELAKSLGVSAPRVKRLRTDDAESVSETSLRTGRGPEMHGIKLPLLREGLDRFAVQYRDGWGQRCGWRSVTPSLLQHAA